MASAYILINTDVGAEQEVLDQLKSMPEVTEAAAVYGIYDIVCRIESDTMEKLRNHDCKSKISGKNKKYNDNDLRQ